MNATEALDELIAELEHSIEVDTIRLDLARQLRATYAAGDKLAELAKPEPTTDAVEARRERDRQRKRKSRTPSSGFTCPDCGTVLPTERGLATHRGQKHKDSAAPKPDAPKFAAGGVVPAPRPVEPVDATRYFVCTSCDAKATSREGLAKHTTDVHHRGLKGEEHFAKAGAA